MTQTLTAVAETADLAQRLSRYLQHRLGLSQPPEIMGVQQVAGGASRETWMFDAVWRDGDGEQRRELIVRRDPVAGLLDSDRDLEFAVYQAVQNTPVPVPPVYWLERDPQWLDRPFFIMGRMPGVANPPQMVVGGAFGPPERIGEQMARILAALHAIDWRARGLESLGPPGVTECALREVDRWHATYCQDALEPRPALDAAFRWLRAHPPVASRVVLVHGDYRTGNYLVTEDGVIRAMLDWELAHLGDPMEDLGWTCMRFWRWAGDDRVGGVLLREQFFRLYEEAGGAPVDLKAVHYWEVFGNVKMAIICITGARSYAERRTTNPTMAMVGRAVAALELELLDMLGL